MDRKYWFWINNIKGIGNIKVRRLLKAFDDCPRAVYEADMEKLKRLCAEAGLSKRDFDLISDKEYAEIIFEKYGEYNCRGGISFVVPTDENYPKRLKELYDRPNIIYYKGRLPDEGARAVAVVGSRNCSEYGRSVARELGRRLGAAGASVISGLALGIDREAHRGAVMGGGRSYGVLAGGADICYPAGNFNIYMDLQRDGGVISEFAAGTPTRAGMFPLRNRIISGLSDAVIVVEAGQKSGTLITVAQALEQNRQVYAVPGRMGDTDSLGCNRLISEGARIITDLDGLMEELGLCADTEPENKKINLLLATDEKMLYSQLLDFNPKSLDTLFELCDMPPQRIFSALLELELKGLIRETAKNFYIRIR
ncbi:MAG: DNA-processing protein DprA [Butyrivibrio sp.]|nr:DNA-processing protein DprA [Butyrivibrio sp.]